MVKKTRNTTARVAASVVAAVLLGSVLPSTIAASNFNRNEMPNTYTIASVKEPNLVENEIYDWTQVEGTYNSTDGNFGMSLRIDDRYADEEDVGRNLSILVTDNDRGEEYVYGGYITGNSVEFNDDFSVLSILMTLSPDGLLSVSDAGEQIFTDYSLNITGVYEKVSDEIHPFPFKIKYSYFNIPGEIDEDSQEEPYDVVSYTIPKITGLGDDEFEKYVNQCITDFITVPALAFEEEYKELLKNPEMKEFSTRYGYASDVYVLSTSKDYYAIAINGYEYRGGAHGMPFTWVFNIGVKEKKFLTLADLFKDKGYKEILEERLSRLAETDKYQEMMFPDITEVSIYDEESSFYLTSENLVIYFHPYDIGPYAAGFIRFKIPLAELADILNDGYLDAEYFPGIGEYLLFDPM